MAMLVYGKHSKLADEHCLTVLEALQVPEVPVMMENWGREQFTLLPPPLVELGSRGCGLGRYGQY